MQSNLKSVMSVCGLDRKSCGELLGVSQSAVGTWLLGTRTAHNIDFGKITEFRMKQMNFARELRLYWKLQKDQKQFIFETFDDDNDAIANGWPSKQSFEFVVGMLVCTIHPTEVIIVKKTSDKPKYF